MLIGLPHRVSEDDLYDGYFIPKGTMIIANVWAIMHDPEKFDNPMQFDPERYLINGRLSPEVDDPSAGFGFGRRCVNFLMIFVCYHLICRAMLEFAQGVIWRLRPCFLL